MKNNELNLYYGEEWIGVLRETPAHHMEFQYTESWLVNPNRFPVSQSLPLEAGLFAREAQNYFANLLPEGDVRLATASQMGISPENDFRLLEALGGECAGALTLGHEALPYTDHYRNLDPQELLDLYRAGRNVFAGLQDLEKDIRMSLAGAQDKIPVYIQDEKLYLPQGNSPSSHILKLPSKSLAHLPENECAVAMLADKMGLEVAKPHLLKVADLNFYVVERYDRSMVNKKLIRLHQEDFCQALGVSYKLKYESDGGPRFKDCYSLVEQASFLLPEDLDHILKWLVFNVVAGNCDAHAKNISLLMIKPDLWKVSPHYDLVSTKVYPRLSKNLAMSIGGSHDSGTITGSHWDRLADEVQVAPKYLRTLVQEFAELSLPKFDETNKEFVDLYGKSPVLPQIRKVIYEQQRRLLSQLNK